MANKLKVNKKKVSESRYFKGLSVAEMDDVEQSVEDALENPAGTFTIVTQELNFRLSNMQKSIKTIGVDTKYIRKAIDKLDKKLDEMGGGGSGFNLGDAASFGASALALRGGAGALATKGASRFLGKAALGRAGLMGLTALALHEGMNYVDPPDESGESSLDKWLGRNVFDLNGKMYEWTGIGVDRKKFPLNKLKEAISQKISDRMSQPYGINQMPANVFKEFNPTERAKIIAERLKLMTQVPGMMGGGMAAGALSGLSGMTPDWPTGSGGGGSSGGGRGGGGGGGWGDDSPAKPQLPSLTPSEFMALEKSGLAGTRDNSYKVLPTTPGQYRPVYAGIENDIKNRDLINIIGNEARRTNESTDAVINNMMNRLGSKNYGNAQTLTEVAKQKGQYESWDFLQSGRFRPVDEARAKHIEERLRLIASGQTPDTTGGANEFRAASYVFGRGRGKTFARLAEQQGNKNLGGNVYANTGYEPGPYAAYTPEQIEANKRMVKPGQKIDPMAVVQNTNTLVNSAPQVPSATVVTNAEKPTGKLFKNSHLATGVDADLIRVAEKAARDNPGLFGMPSPDDMEGVVSGKRTTEQQKAMVDRGWSKTMKSKHVEGRAIDLWPINPKTGKLDDTYDEGYAKINAAMKKAAKELNIPVETGGDWKKFVDKPHWQLASGYQSSGKTYNEPIDQKVEKLEKKVAKIDKVVQPEKKVTYANSEVKPPMTKSEQLKTSDSNFLEDRTKTQSAPGKGNMEPTLAEKQAKLKEEHRRYILDKNSDPKPPVKKTYDTTPFKERFPNFSTAADPNFGAKKITPENNPADVAMEMAKKALEESVKTANAAVAHAKELIKNVVATPPPKLPQSSANKPPLANLPKTAKKGVSNPTDKAPGADSAKTNTAPPLEDLLPQGGQYFP